MFMRPIPPKLRKQLAEDPKMKVCARNGWDCAGRITWEHAFIYAGRQINEAWAIVPLCEYHHLGKGLNKKLNRQIAISQATPEDLQKYPKKDWNYV